MRRLGESSNWTKRERRSTESAISSIWKKSVLWVSRSGWLEDFGCPEKVEEALAAGAAGVQVGTAFAFCAESALRADYKQALLAKAISGEARVFTDTVASPTSFPFKVARLEGTSRGRGLFRSAADLRPGLFAGTLQDADGDDRLPLLRRSRCHRPSVEGWKSGEYGGKEMSLQCSHGEYRPSQSRNGKLIDH